MHDPDRADRSAHVHANLQYLRRVLVRSGRLQAVPAAERNQSPDDSKPRRRDPPDLRRRHHRAAVHRGRLHLQHWHQLGWRAPQPPGEQLAGGERHGDAAGGRAWWQQQAPDDGDRRRPAIHRRLDTRQHTEQSEHRRPRRLPGRNHHLHGNRNRPNRKNGDRVGGSGGAAAGAHSLPDRLAGPAASCRHRSVRLRLQPGQHRALRVLADLDRQYQRPTAILPAPPAPTSTATSSSAARTCASRSPTPTARPPKSSRTSATGSRDR